MVILSRRIGGHILNKCVCSMLSEFESNRVTFDRCGIFRSVLKGTNLYTLVNVADNFDCPLSLPTHCKRDLISDRDPYPSNKYIYLPTNKIRTHIFTNF